MGSHGPQQKINIPAEIDSPLVLLIVVTLPLPAGVFAANDMHSTPFCRQLFHQRSHGLAGQQESALRLQHAPGYIVEAKLRPAASDLLSFELFPRDSRVCSARGPTLFRYSSSVAAQPEHACLPENLSSSARRKIAPGGQRLHRPARVKFIRAVPHANHSSFAARAGAAVCRSVGIQQCDRSSALVQKVRRPRAEHTRADDCNVVRLHLRHYAPNNRLATGNLATSIALRTVASSLCVSSSIKTVSLVLS